MYIYYWINKKKDEEPGPDDKTSFLGLGLTANS